MIFFAILAGIIALVFSGALFSYIARQDKGSPKMQELYLEIRNGSRTYLKRQYKAVISISIAIGAILYVLFDFGNLPFTSAAFLLGAVCSLVASFFGMETSTRANVRTAQAALTSTGKMFKIAFSGGIVMGLANVGLSLLGISGLYLLYGSPNAIISFGFGASLSALFALLGGGIFTKAADIGADLVGKIEKNIPEDDPRNPAVIADNVGDNVGDVAGRGADLFESCTGENIAAMVLGVSLYAITQNIFFIIFPLLAKAIGIFATIIGTVFVRAHEGQNPMTPLRNGLIATSIFCVFGFYFLIDYAFGSIHLFLAAMTGLGASLLIMLAAEYYTTKRNTPVKKIVQSSQTGAATNIIAGLSVGMASTALPVIIISATLLVSYFLGTLFGNTSGIESHLGGVYGTAVATIGMLSIAGMVLGLDGFGPIVDNARGIAQMSGAKKEVVAKLDVFDSVGNTTKALTKAYAIATAGLAALLLLQAYLEISGVSAIDIVQPKILIAAFLGMTLPFVFAAYVLKGVGRAAYRMVDEVRRQFKTIKGILSGKSKPNYAKCIDISTLTAQKEMLVPGMLSIIAPIAVGFLFGASAAGAFLLSATLSGFVLAMFMNNGGAAWDNAKKAVEETSKKGTPQHSASVVGDLVGDPLKDTVGPSLHVLIKLIGTLSITFALMFSMYAIL